MTPRDRARDLARSAAPPIGAFAAALAAGALLIALTGKNPFSVYAALLDGTLGSAYAIGQTIAKATPLIFTGLSVAIAFRAGLFNVGAEGQMTVGGLSAALAGIALAGAPSFVAIPLELLAAAAGGALVALVPAWLRARRGVHEVISTIFLNFIAAAAAGSILTRVAVHATVRTEELEPAARLPRLSAVADLLGLSSLADALRPAPASTAAFLAIAAAIAVGWYLTRTVGGFETRVTGENPDAARTGGIDVARVTVRSLLLAGALAGLGGTGYVMGAKYYYETGFAAGAGFTGIAVALLGRNRPLGIILAALLFGALSQGGLSINSQVSSELVNVLQALTILFLIAALAWTRAHPRAVREEDPA